MRINESIEIAAPPEAVWEYLANPENYLHFLHGITRWEIVGERRSGLGTRIRMLIRVGAAEVGGLIEVVEWKEGSDIAWHSITGIDQRGRWMIRRAGGDRTRVEMRWTYGVVGGGIFALLSERIAAPRLRSNLRQSLEQLKRQVEHEQIRTAARQNQAA